MTSVPCEIDNETRALLTLRLVPGLGPRLTRALLDRFQTAEAVIRAPASQLAEVPRISLPIAQQLAAAFHQVDVDGEIALMQRHGVRLLRLGSPGYPPLLASIYDPPPLLYVRGEMTEADDLCVAIVGSRHCSAYGRRIAERLARTIARAGITVVSGLARGIDAIAHRSALEAGGRTIAILAGGLSRIYPPEHTPLAERITTAGALLSETPMRFDPLPQMFPARNRLISGLCRGVVIVEASARSGALLTAKHAADQGREVFAVPGPIDSDTSQGTLDLLQNGATLVRDADDVLRALGQLSPIDSPKATSTGVAARPLPSLTEEQRAVFDALSAEPLHGDELAERTGFEVSQLANVLLALELNGLVRRLPGNRFERSR